MTTFRVGSATDVGRVRSNNQDSFLVREYDLFAVADGMGGHQGGEVASSLALEVLDRAHVEATTETLVHAVQTANQAVYERADSDPGLKGMGTTLTVLADVDTEDGRRLSIANVGDSRLYRLRSDTLEQLTEDHSLVAGLVRQGRITEEEAENHPQRNILTRALGIDEVVAVDSWEVDPVAGDRFLICSDGLFNEVDQNRLVATLRRFDDPADASRELVRLANEGGGRDNITAVVVDIVETDGAASATDTARHDAVVADADPVVAATPPLGPDDLDEVDGQADEPRSRRLTWRVVVFVLALLVLLGAVAGALGWYARNTFYVTIDDEQVTIFKGRPGGFLWFDPTVEVRTGIPVEDVPEAELSDLEEGVDQATLGDAENYVENLQRQIDQDDIAEEPEDEPATTTTTTEPEDTGGGAGTGTGGGAGGGDNKPGNG
jgi:PPM family protein phosphatase